MSRPVLYYTALSPFCRKVRMALDHRGIEHDLVDDPTVEEAGHLSPRAEAPALVHGELVVQGSADIVAYLEDAYPEAPSLYPEGARARAEMRAWERASDTFVDAVLVDASVFLWSDLGPAPEGLAEAARRDVEIVYRALDAQLEGGPFVAGERLSIADLALYAQLSAGPFLGLPCPPECARVRTWLRRVRGTEAGRRDAEAIAAYMAGLRDSNTRFDKINWNSFRLEWMLANGFGEYILDEYRAGRMLWSVGPERNGLRSELLARCDADTVERASVVITRVPRPAHGSGRPRESVRSSA